MKQYTTVLVLTLAVIAGRAEGQTQPNTIAPFVDNNTFAVARYDLTRTDSDQAAIALLAFAELALDTDAVMNARAVSDLLTTLRKLNCREVWSVFRFSELGIKHAFVIPLGPGVDSKKVAELSPRDGLSDWQTLAIDNAVVIGKSANLQQWATIKPAARPELAKALAVLGDAPCQVCLMPSETTRRAIEELLPILPPERGGGASTVLTRGMVWTAIGLNAGPKGSLQVVVQAKDDAAAAKLRQWLTAMLNATSNDKAAKEIWKDFSPLAGALSPTANGDQLTMNLKQEQTKALVEPLVASALRRADYQINALCLRAVAKSIHLYYDFNKFFPTPANYDKQGKPLLSWRVHVLPYLGHQELYDEFKLDEPWDSPHNKKLIARMPAVYRHYLGQGAAEGKTPLVVPLGPGTIFPGGKGTTFAEITDGTSATILVLQAADDNMVIWTKPDDWQFDPKQPRRGLPVGFYAAFADAGVRYIGPGISTATLQALMTRNAGDVPGEDLYDPANTKGK